MDCNKTEQLKVGNVSVWQLEGQTGSFFFYKAGMAVDADGAPRAYHPEPDSDLGLDRLANAGRPGNWFAIVTDNGQPGGKPIVQRPNDPAPGFYVSLTSLQDQTKDRTDPLRYVDATQIPYIVLPPEVQSKFDVQLGDFAVVINGKSGQHSEAIFADVGPRGKIGEGSIALANKLGIPSSPRDGGTDSGVVYVVFPLSGNGNPRSLDEIKSRADAQFEVIGGIAQLLACFPELGHPSPTVPTIPTLKSSYSGTSMKTNPAPSITDTANWSVTSQDSHGNITITATYPPHDTIFSCNGTVDSSGNISLHCSSSKNSFDFSGKVTSDGSIQGTEKFSDGTTFRDQLS